MPLDSTTYVDTEALCEQDEVLRVLVEADRLLSGPEKWIKCGPYVGPKRQQMCIYGALAGANRHRANAIHGNICREPGYEEAATMLWNIAGFEFTHNLTRWNDAPERTFSDVKTLFAKAIQQRARELLETRDG